MRKAVFPFVMALALILLACAGCTPQERIPASQPEALPSPSPAETAAAADGPQEPTPDVPPAAEPEETPTEPEEAPTESEETPTEPEETVFSSRSNTEIIREMAYVYANYGSFAETQIETLLRELKAADPDAAVRWTRIMELWRSVDAGLPVNADVLPDGLSDTDSLCIVVLGFQLNPDGSMRPELLERLQVALRCAEKYPNAYVLCTGGPTAYGNAPVTEAGCMAAWLIENGVDPDRVIVEDRSLSTAQNAIFSFEILEEQYPMVSELAIVSTGYHIPTGLLVFGAESFLRAEEAGEESLRIVSNAAWAEGRGSLSSMYRAACLIELAGDRDTAFAIYYGVC